MAAEYGVADEGYTTQAAFLDYDRDGDLDLFVINNSPRPVSSFGDPQHAQRRATSTAAHKLYHNDGGHFTDVSAQAGIYGSEIGFGLGRRRRATSMATAGPTSTSPTTSSSATTSTSTTQRHLHRVARRRRCRCISYFSMGLDIADMNNDGWPDIYTTDMLPEDEYRLQDDVAVRELGASTRRR